MPKSWLKRITVLGFATIALVFGLLLVEHVRGRLALARYIRHLRAEGEATSVGDLFIAAPPQNAAPKLMSAVHQLSDGTLLPAEALPRMRLTASGTAVVCFRESCWVENKITNDWDQVFSELKTNASTLAEISFLLNEPYFDNALDYSRGPAVLLRHLLPLKRLANWFGAETQLALHDGRLNDATAALTAETRLPCTMVRDRVLISALVRIALCMSARTDIWEALQSDGWKDSQLSAIQSAWAENQYLTNVSLSFQDERVSQIRIFDEMRRSLQTAAEFLWWNDAISSTDEEAKVRPSLRERLTQFLKTQISARIWRFAWLDQDESRYLKGLQHIIEIDREAINNKSYIAAKRSLERLETVIAPHNWFDQFRFPQTATLFSLTRSTLRSMRAETERSIVLCTIALKRFSLRHGSLPTSLNELIPEFLSELPVDYMVGQPLRYKLLSNGEFRLYSVGEDGVDDGGDASLRPSKPLRDWWQRKDVVWPAPASEEEVKAYRASEWEQ